MIKFTLHNIFSLVRNSNLLNFTLKFFSQNNKLYIKNFLTSQKATNTFTVNQLENVRAIYPKTDDIQRRADEGQDIM